MKVLCMLLAATGLMSAEQVEGTVRNSLTGVPVGMARLDFTPAGTTSIPIKADSAGKFRLDDKVLGGAWELIVSSSGFATRNFTYRGKPSATLLLDIAPLAQLSGQVRDSSGKPLGGIRVIVRENGLAQSLATNQQGSYSVSLPAGSYTIGAIPPTRKPAGIGQRGTDESRKKVLAPTWYPGATFAEAAVQIHLAPGQEFKAADVVMQEDWAHNISGRVIGIDGKPAGDVMVTLEPAKDWVGSAPDSGFRTGPDGAFHFQDMTEGEYLLSAVRKTGTTELRAESALNLTTNVSEVSLQLSLRSSLTGIARCEDESGAPPVRGHLSLMPGINGASAFTGAIADGQFLVEKMYPGAYRIQAFMEGCFLSALTMDGQDVLGRRVEIMPSSKIVLTFRRKGGHVRGTVEAPAVQRLLLIPADPNLIWPDLAFSTAEISNGHFEIANVRPGSYYALALAAGSEWTMLRGRALDPSILNNATSLTVKEGETAEVQLKSVYR